ncbi:MAG: TetR/AcrR family transcriptional regulator [Halioglobus sp.]
MSGTSTKGEGEVIDGRRLRSERSRSAIIDAMVALQDEGILVPTAQQVAERSGINIRSLFRHFEDMEALFKAADVYLRDSYEAPFLGGDREGTLDERIEHAVERHAAAYEKVGNMVLSTQAQMWRYETLRKNYARNQRGLRKDLDDWLSELKDCPPWRREAIDAIASFEMWHRLRFHQGQSRKAAIQIVANLLKEQLID